MTATLPEAKEALIQAFSQFLDAFEGREAVTAEPTTPASAPAKSSVTLVEVREALAEMSRSGRTAQVRELIAQHGGAKLSDLDESAFPALLAAARGLADA